MEHGRDIRFDLMRILSILGFFLCAVAYRTILNSGYAGSAYISSLVYICLGSFCIPLLFMLSGAHLLDPDCEFSYKRFFLRLVRLCVAGLFWTCVYTAILFIMDKQAFNLRSFIYQAYVNLTHMRYLLLFVCVYLTIPIFRMLVVNKRATQYFLVVSFICASVLPLLKYLPEVYRASYVLPYLEVSAFSSTAWLMVAGYYFKANPPKLSGRIVIYALSVLALVFTFFAIYNGYRIVSRTISVINANYALYALGIFVLFSTRATEKLSGDKLSRVVGSISKCSLGAFILCLFFIKALSMEGLTGMTFSTWASVPVTAFVSCIASYGFSYILSGIPIVNKWLM